MTINNSYTSVEPYPRPGADWMARHEAVLERIKQGRVDMVLIGDSLTQRWEGEGKELWYKYYASRHAVNMGFDGDGTSQVLWRLDHGEIDGISPKLAVVLIGSNHVNSKIVEEITEGIKAVCCKIRTKLPHTKILLLAIVPRGDASAAAAYGLNKASEDASQIADGRTIFYLNMREKFIDKDGNVRKDLVVIDGVHLNSNGYKIWAETMEPIVSKLMGEK